MFRSLTVSLLLVSLALFGLAALPAYPRTETASVQLDPTELETPRTLLGENPGGRVSEAFRHLADLRDGDRVTLRDAEGEKYHYRVYKRLVVDPTDIWVTQPVEKDNIVSLQTCYPEPTFEKRLVVRAALIDGGEGRSAAGGR